MTDTPTNETIPCIPPNDYSGSMAAWDVALLSRGLMAPGDFYGDVEVTLEVYGEILEECEGNR
jgi:hypothetical protein